MNLLALLRDRFAAALRAMGVDTADVPGLAAMVLPSQDAKFGDYQANLRDAAGQAARQAAARRRRELVERLDVADLCEPPEIAGPGFINLRLRDDWLRRATCDR